MLLPTVHESLARDPRPQAPHTCSPQICRECLVRRCNLARQSRAVQL